MYASLGCINIYLLFFFYSTSLVFDFATTWVYAPFLELILWIDHFFLVEGELGVSICQKMVELGRKRLVNLNYSNHLLCVFKINF